MTRAGAGGVFGCRSIHAPEPPRQHLGATGKAGPGVSIRRIGDTSLIEARQRLAATAPPSPRSWCVGCEIGACARHCDGTLAARGQVPPNLARLTAGSPAIDVGDGSAAPDLDIVGNPRWNYPSASNKGDGSPTYTDFGAYEYGAFP